jgi:hypothetical protein
MSQLHLMQRANLYRLKRDYGGPIDIYQLVSSATDSRTGVTTLATNKTHVRCAAIMPATQSRKAIARGQIKSTGTYDIGICDFIIDRKDAPSLATLTSDDWIVANGHKYQVGTVESFQVNEGWIVTGREMVGEVPQQTFDLKSENVVTAVNNVS